MTDFRLNSTSTKVPLWQQDCESFRRTLRPFILRDVTDPEHLNFVDDFARQYALRAERVVLNLDVSLFGKGRGIKRNGGVHPLGPKGILPGEIVNEV